MVESLLKPNVSEKPMPKPFYLPSELWVIQTSNNPGSYDMDDEKMFIKKTDAESEAKRLCEARHGGRADYLVRSLDEVIYDTIQEATYNAMSED